MSATVNASPVPRSSTRHRVAALVAAARMVPRPGVAEVAHVAHVNEAGQPVFPRADVVDVIEGELLTDAPVTVCATSAALLDAFIDDRGRLVPARTMQAVSVEGEDAEKALVRARSLDELRARAFADATLVAYGGALRAWRAWCRAEKRPVLPFDPQAVVHHLLDYALEWDQEANDYAKDATGNLVPAVALSSIEIRLHGLNRAAEFIGLPRPGENPGVAEVMRGIRRVLGASKDRRKAALDFPKLTQCLAAAEGPTFVVARARALVLVRARTGASTGQLVKLSWPDVTLTDAAVTLQLPADHRSRGTRTVLVERHRNPDLCLVRALTDLRKVAPALQEIFTNADGTPLSRQAPYLALRGAAEELGGWNALPDLDDRDLPAVLARAGPRPRAAVTRDRSLLLTGFFTAGRRSNLSALNWGDLVDHEGDGWSAKFRFSKTDPLGTGHTAWVPHDGSHTCAATALREWMRELTHTLGRPPKSSEPVFVALDAAGDVKLTSSGRPRRLSGDGINQVIQRLTIAAGLTQKPKKGEYNPYGAHSLRAGFVTEALRDDKLSVPEVADVTGHQSLDVLFGYRREVNAAKRNPARKLLNKLAKK